MHDDTSSGWRMKTNASPPARVDLQPTRRGSFHQESSWKPAVWRHGDLNWTSPNDRGRHVHQTVFPLVEKTWRKEKEESDEAVSGVEVQ